MCEPGTGENARSSTHDSSRRCWLWDEFKPGQRSAGFANLRRLGQKYAVANDLHGPKARIHRRDENGNATIL
jgi:hypothetical protein